MVASAAIHPLIVGSDLTMRKVKLTKTEKAYEAIRKAIVTGRLAKNSVLNEQELMRTFNHGRTPIREALKRLTLERFVVWPARGTPYVRGASVNDLQRLYEARLILEVPIMRMAANRISSTELRALEKLCDDLETAIACGDIYVAVEIDYAIHVAFAKGSNNEVLAEAIVNLMRDCLNLWYNASAHFGVEEKQYNHRYLVASLRSGNAEESERLIREHIISSYRRQLKVVELDLEQFVTGAEGSPFEPIRVPAARKIKGVN
jgi:DNA-binding GntR family transcriptional regulator